MAQITLKGNPIHTSGDLPKVGAPAPDFTLTKMDLSEVSKGDLKGRRVILNIFPSVDTPTCAASERMFSKRAAEKPNTAILCVSADLPFAQKRFCAAEGISAVEPVSTFRHGDFLDAYGVKMTDGPLRGLCARAVVVLDEAGTVLHTEMVSEIANEPNYDAALARL
ncbi:MAG: thiol peroxidase [Acidobacteria bacterium]|nr:thiol peroxidase [Acidobacteriota bacterium]